MTNAVLSARRAARGDTMSGLARWGLAARAFSYLLIGWIGLQIALGHHTHQANQSGALAEVGRSGIGLVLLWLLGLGFGAYALWRLSEAAFGSVADGSDAGARAKSAVRGVVYASLCVSTFAFIAGDGTGQKQQQSSTTAQVMRHDLGRWAVGVAGLVVIVVGVAMIVEGARRTFLDQLETGRMSARTRQVVTRLGMVGTIARGIVFGVAGVLVVAAAVTFDPKKSTGLDGAMRTLAGQPYGPWLLGALALGLIAFGVFGFAAARWTRT